ncbi:AraC family transcriptional regulator, arabinose operon regulatory protein [Paenibacillus sp. UNC496MF]|uniref:helix-turn-helix domain-containing protein n=1 Tax=Paenibacillus sp. UNC496MF TaxID=1502753 RepID=UPI0008EDAF32|nr:AraC family transcriptional regulator [Paenibacillus sp. UNC496MF]SFI89862.1 AraC family transcriptional regulator, arabinose operon regulatory protein [Paenibacillus sp. UNC496MF]
MYAEIMSCGYSYHTQPFQMTNPEGLRAYLFRLQTEGACEALVDGRMQRIVAGDLLMFKPGDSYSLNVSAQPQDESSGAGPGVSSGDYFVICRGEWLDHWWSRKERLQRVKVVPDERWLSLWQALILEKRRFENGDSELADYLLRALCLGLDRAADTQSELQGKSFIATRMKNFIDEQAALSFTVADVAAHVGLSVSRTVHLFKECFGLTIIQYTQNVRLSMAIERIKYSSMTLEQVAETCGFGSYSYFYRVFRQKHGVSPAAYRER